MTTQNHALEQANSQANSIAAMVAALGVDYDRLQELKDDRASYDHAEEWNFKNQDESQELAELEEDANGNTNEEQAREAIQNDALDVQVRSDWHNPGDTDNSPSEFMILLCTGGPAVRIMGELNQYCEPCRAWIEYQDWGTPWTHAVGVIDQETLLAYCQQFYFGE